MEGLWTRGQYIQTRDQPQERVFVIEKLQAEIRIVDSLMDFIHSLDTKLKEKQTPI
jgi:hypothetical protein